MRVITFLIPDNNCDRPVGGFKVVFEYANRLVAHGYSVNIVFPQTYQLIVDSFAARLKNIYLTLTQKPKNRIGDIIKCSWFSVDPRVQMVAVKSLNEQDVPESDVYIATFYTTAYYLNRYRSENKYYLVQALDYFDETSKKLVLQSYKLNLKLIAISKYLHRVCERYAEQSVELLNNGFDFKYFALYNNIECRSSRNVLVMYHPGRWKGFNETLEALRMVLTKYPDLNINIFGAYPDPKICDLSYNYFHSPARELHNKLYNEASLYLTHSKNEGWGLPVGEAMICGACVVCSDIGGFDTMAIGGETALVFKVGDVEAMAEKILFAIENDLERIRIAKNANEFIRQFTWDKSYAKLVRILNLS